MQNDPNNPAPIKARQWHKKWWGQLLIVIFCLVVITIAGAAYFFIKTVKNIQRDNIADLLLTRQNLDQGAKKTIEGANNYWIGSARPKITIVEFADFNCPYCGRSYPTIREISLTYKDQVKIIYRDFPLRDGSVALALAGRCAGEQGLFWLMHDKLFQNQGIASSEEINALALQIGADLAKFNDCLTSQKYLPQIEQDLLDGQSLNITGTPTWFINGHKVEGEIPRQTFIELVENLIKDE
jgi:protein-disulfide isomerase